MASLINIFVPIAILLKDAELLIKSNRLYVYAKPVGANQKVPVLLDTADEKLFKAQNRVNVFITAEPFDKKQHQSFYNDNFFTYAIEVKGGRSTNEELEMLSLRVIAKEPDKRIKAFINKLQKSLKQNDAYGMGIGPGNYHSKIFYHRQEVKGKTLWNDFERKITPVVIPD
ncbi:hypothetical protein LT679_16900 [Mucilaginibacter roseus]|uniref:Uncharacterized protein n=1 Tax=Mucilaginibacter roseus TaxID=1528868 RepID=A0ABS8U7Z2_9SPHI|nr:hypothetical protein [Mucilaginibacter roseus]MCD8742290.1 hypothetical protein [Mucilaginibacter roseus]